jgi:hypothetical protein
MFAPPSQPSAPFSKPSPNAEEVGGVDTGVEAMAAMAAIAPNNMGKVFPDILVKRANESLSLEHQHRLHRDAPEENRIPVRRKANAPG